MEEIDVIYDRYGKPVFRLLSDGRLVMFSGINSGFLVGDNLYDYRGRHVGWYSEGLIRDHHGHVVGFGENVTDYIHPFLPFKQYKPFSGYVQYEPFRPFLPFEPFRPFKSYGYILVFKPTVRDNQGKSKGNVDAELVLHAAAVEFSKYDRAVIVSGDGDFYCLYEFLEKNKKLFKIIIPNRKSESSLLSKFQQYKIFLIRDREKVERK